MEELPASKLAVLSCGLPPDSRTMLCMSGQRHPTDTLLLAAIVDRLSMLVWLNSEDGHKGRNRPASILSELNKEKNHITYSNGAEFEAAREKLLKGG